MSSAERVWFLLVDSKGAGYMGAMADFVRLPEDAIVADLRKAVHAEYDKPGYLKDIPAGVLTVYKNAAHIHARDTEGPLKASTPLKPGDLEEGALGASEDEALIVLVPSPSGMNPCFFGKVRHILSTLCM